MNLNHFGTLLALLLVPPLGNGGELYRWTDKDGRVHYGNSVPDSRKDSAKAIDLTNARVTTEQRQEAQDRSAREKHAGDKRPPSPAQAPTAEKRKLSDSASSTPDFPSGRRACEEEWRKYRESMACFAPYVLAKGGVKAEAFKVCKEMKMPALCN